jgi:hypothetical protein
MVGITNPSLFQVQRGYSVAEIPLRRKNEMSKPAIAQSLGENAYPVGGTYEI